MSDTPAPKRRRPRWRGLLSGLLILLAGGCVAGVFGARQFLVRDAQPEQAVITQVVPVERGELVEEVPINGALEPVDRAEVGFASAGRVSAVLVQAGDSVRVGAVLARLETRDLQLAVTSRQAELDQAQQVLAKLMAGPSEAELATVAAAVARARANLAVNGAEVRAIDIELARERVAAARQALADLDGGQGSADLDAAQTQRDSAEDGVASSLLALERTRDSASRAKTDAEQALERGAQAVVQAQRTYSDAYWDWDYVQSTGRHPREKLTDESGREIHRKLEDHEVEQFRRTLADATVALRNAETELQNLREGYDQAREEEVLQIQEAERAVETARRGLAEAQEDVTRAGTRGLAAARLAARQELAEAEQGLDELVNDPTRPVERIELDAALLEAIAAQEQLRAGPDPVELARARSAIEQARADLAAAEADLDEATLRAPIAGTVVEVGLKPGTLSAQEATIAIVDLRSFRIRGQVTEQNVARVRPGQEVRISVDSLPDLELRGRLSRVSELPDSQGADTQGGPFGPSGGALGGLYPVEILVEAADERLRVGMATTASIAILAIPDTLIIPLQAVELGPDGPSVRRAIGAPGPDGQPPSELVPVQLGERSGELVQVLGGLSEGDQLLLPQLPPPDGPPGQFRG